MKGKDTHLLFCTTGILLRRLLADRNLKGVTHVIVDEIHERGMNEGWTLNLIECLPFRRFLLNINVLAFFYDRFSAYCP